MGRWENPRAHDGSRHWYLFRSRKETEEEAVVGLPLGELEVSQLVVLQILSV